MLELIDAVLVDTEDEIMLLLETVKAEVAEGPAVIEPIVVVVVQTVLEELVAEDDKLTPLAAGAVPVVNNGGLTTTPPFTVVAELIAVGSVRDDVVVVDRGAVIESCGDALSLLDRVVLEVPAILMAFVGPAFGGGNVEVLLGDNDDSFEGVTVV